MGVDILQVADQVAREKGIGREVVIEAMESAMQSASRKKYGLHKNIQARLDKETGEFHLQQLREVVDEGQPEIVETYEPDLHVFLEEALKINPEACVGSFIAKDLPPFEFGRIAAQTVKQVIVQRIRDAERQRIYEEYSQRTGQIINGVVKQVERRSIYVDLGSCEAVLPYEQQLTKERYRQGDRIRCYVHEVHQVTRGPQIFLSRTHPEMLRRLFEMEVPEIYDGIVEIKAVARDPGLRSKMAVRTNDANIDPVGACVGIQGSRVQGVVSELHGERIDIIEWSSQPATFVCNALAPAEVNRVVVDEEEQSIRVVVAEDQLSLAIGRRGQNVRLASDLTAWKIDLVDEREDREKRAEEYNDMTHDFQEKLDVGEEVASALVEEGFSSIEDVAYVPLEELAGIEGFDAEIARELRSRARTCLLQTALEDDRKDGQKETSSGEGSELSAKEGKAVLNPSEGSSSETETGTGAETEISNIKGVTKELVTHWMNNGVRSLDDLADLATDELMDISSDFLDASKAGALILEARRLAGWFDDEA